MGSAWTLLSTNIKRVAKAIWLPALLLALASSAAGVVNLRYQASLLSGQIATEGVAALLLMTALTLLAVVFLNARIFKLLNLQPMKFCFGRSLKSMLIGIAMTLLFILIFFGLGTGCFLMVFYGMIASTIALVAFLILSFILLALMLTFYSPMAYALTKYMVEPESSLKMLWKDYKTGLKKLGFIIGFLLLSAVVVSISFCIIALPGVIMSLAALFSSQGVALGDAPGLPANFPLLMGLTTFLTGFVAAVLQVWYQFATYYMYGSVSAQTVNK